MATSPSNSVSEPARVEQVINEFFAKSLHIILESRSPYVSSRNYCGDHYTSSPSSSSSSSSGRPRDKWFNLALRDCPAALENFDLWRQSNLEPLVIDVVLTKRQSKDLWSQDEFLMEQKSERVVERWIARYDNRKSSKVVKELPLGGRKSGGSSSRSSENSSMYKKIYDRTTIMLRSLYCTVRILPAFKVFRELNSSGRICPFSLSHKISTFVEPFTRTEDAEMNHFNFVPVDTSCGRLLLSVSYIPTLEVVNSEPSTPMSAQFIPDYVGSPTTDRLKRLLSLPSGGSLPSYVSFGRRHSWSNDDGTTSSATPSPSPTYSESRVMQCTRNPGLPPRSHPPPADYFPMASLMPHISSPLSHRKNTSFDEFWPSPPFSPSSSPSTPSHLPEGHVQNALPRAGSAPVTIALPRHGGSSRLVNHVLVSSPRKSDILRAQTTGASLSDTYFPDSKLQLRKLSGEFYVGMNLQKILYSGKDEVGNLSGRKLPAGRFRLLDEFDDSEFACPFAEDDEDLQGSCRAEIPDTDIPLGDSASREMIPFRRSSDAAVGSLVRMLKTAAPLRQDFSNSSVSSQSNREQELFTSKTATDALGELKCYKDIKDSLLKKHGNQDLSSEVDEGDHDKFKSTD